jgi:hypothetical protein
MSIHTRKITDSCRDKDCIEDLRVYLTAGSQALLEKSTGAKVRCAELLYTYVDVDQVAFDRNHYCIDATFYYRIIADAVIGCSRPAVANTLRLLTLEPTVVGLIESDKLSAGHARTLVRVPKDKQLAFAQEAIKRGYSVREMERAVKMFLTPPEVLQAENQAKSNAKSAELKAFVERMRSVYRTKVSLIGNDKKGRIYIDYYSPEDLYRFEELLDIIEQRL